jgi:predicted MFS family arabinose efflux permease
LPVLTSFALAGLFAVLFSVREHRVLEPLLPPVLLRNRQFAVANLLTFFLYGAFSAVFFLLPFDLIARRGFSASEAGLAFLPIGLVIGLASRRAGRWADTAGPRLPLTLGSALVAFAAVLLALTLANTWLGVAGPMVLMAAGMAIAVAPLTTTAMNAVPEGDAGRASAVNNAVSRLAGLISVVIAGSAAAALYRQRAELHPIAPSPELRFGILPDPSSPGRAALEAAFLDAYQAAMLIAAALAGLAALAAAVLVKARRRTL